MVSSSFIMFPSSPPQRRYREHAGHAEHDRQEPEDATALRTSPHLSTLCSTAAIAASIASPSTCRRRLSDEDPHQALVHARAHGPVGGRREGLERLADAG